MLFIDFSCLKKLKRNLSTYMMRCLIATTQQNRKKPLKLLEKSMASLGQSSMMTIEDLIHYPLLDGKIQNLRVQELENGDEPYRIREMYIEMIMKQTRGLTRVQAESLANREIGVGPELDTHMIPLVVDELLVFHKKEAKKAFKQAHTIVYNAVVDRLKQEEQHDRILNKFILACHDNLDGVTVKAQWGDYLCSEAYAIVKDDIHQ